MKKALLLIVIFLYSAQLYSAEPLVKFYLQDGSSKQYNLSDIDNMKFPNAPDTLQLQVFTNDGKTFYYPAQLIDSIKLSIDNSNENRLHLWHDGFVWDIAIHEIDSINIYYTTHVAVTIGTQHWMYKNLNAEHYRNGDSIPEVRDDQIWFKMSSGAWCYYNNDLANEIIYGKLYNWYAVNDSRGLAPEGWHLPTDEEWIILITSPYLGGDIVVGGKLKVSGISHWKSPNIGATNESGFSALPGGSRGYYGSFYVIGSNGLLWSSTELSTSYAWYRFLGYNFAIIYRGSYYEGSGLSVRCVRDSI